jgi:hypothetical protein
LLILAVEGRGPGEIGPKYDVTWAVGMTTGKHVNGDNTSYKMPAFSGFLH